jgi:hypothetical protein
MMKLAVSVVDLDAPSKGFAELNFGTGEAEAEAEFTGKAILKSAPQALNAALGLRTVGRNVSDAELRKSATELRRLAFPRELFFDRPVVVVAYEDAVLVSIEAERGAVTT